MVALLAGNWVEASRWAAFNLWVDRIDEEKRRVYVLPGYKYQYIDREDNLMAMEITGFVVIGSFYQRPDASDIFKLVITRVRAPNVEEVNR
jgi:hypothetical protein